MAAGHDDRQADRRAGRGAADPGHLQRLDDADQGAHRHAVHRHPHADRHQGLRQGPRRDGAPRQGDRGGRQEGARHDQRLRRAHHRRLSTSTSSPTARRSRATAWRSATCRTSSRPRSAARWSRRPSKAASASASPCATRASCAPTRSRSPAQVLVPTMDGAMIPLGQLATGRGRAGLAGHPHRERAALGLHLRRHPRPRHRLLRGRRAQGGVATA